MGHGQGAPRTQQAFTECPCGRGTVLGTICIIYYLLYFLCEVGEVLPPFHK